MDNTPATGARILFAVLAAGFAVLIVWAALTADFAASFAIITADPWGVVSLADLYLGFVLFAAIIVAVDGARAASIGWVVALMVLGNLVAAVWLILRLPALVRRLRQGAD